MLDNYPPPPRFPVINWALYALLSFVTLGLYSIWTTFEFTREVEKLEQHPIQKKMLYALWGFSVVGMVGFLLAVTLCEDEGSLAILLPAAMAARFGWTFITRSILANYYARVHQRRFLPNGFLMVFAPMLMMIITHSKLETAPSASWTDDPVHNYRDALCMHPALYVFINVSTLFLYGFIMNYTLIQITQVRRPADSEHIKQLWTVLIAQLVIYVFYVFLMDINAPISSFDRTVNIVMFGITIVWAYKYRSFLVEQFSHLYGFELPLSRVFVFFFPTISLMCGINGASNQYDLYQMTRATAAK